jgi:hypothetical protein
MKWLPLFNRETFWLGLWLLAGMIAVIAYNTWSVCCDSCPVEALVTFGWVDGVLLASNFSLVAILGLLRRANRLKIQDDNCSCGTLLRQPWRHCPGCGKRLR